MGQGFGFANLADIKAGIGGQVGCFGQRIAHRRISIFELGTAIKPDANACRIDRLFACRDSKISAGQQGRQHRHVLDTGCKQADGVE